MTPEGFFWSLSSSDLLAIWPFVHLHPEKHPPTLSGSIPTRLCLPWSAPRSCGTAPRAGKTGTAQSLGGASSHIWGTGCCGPSPLACSLHLDLCYGLELGTVVRAHRACGSVSPSLHERGSVCGRRWGRGCGSGHHLRHPVLLLLPGHQRG